MALAIDVDTGGTFTDLVVSGEGHLEWTKADTTPHDLTIGLMRAVDDMAAKLGFKTTKAFLRQVGVIRISTTVGSNTVVQKKGPRLGLIVSKGFEETAYASEGSVESQDRRLDMMVPGGLTAGVKGRVNIEGEVTEHLGEEDVRAAIRQLLNDGARGIVISLRNAPLNVTMEKECKAVVQKLYPPHYIGSVAVVSSNEISLCLDDSLRTNAALLDAYIHQPSVNLLRDGDERIRDAGYLKPVFIVQNFGGVARVARTRGLKTFSSGPAAGAFGVAYLSKLFKVPNMIGFDVGGTTTDLAAVANGEVGFLYESRIEDILVREPMVDVASIAAGGGTIAKVVANKLRMGPESAGAIPGPACYDLGSSQATLTDAFVVLGTISPDYFQGGRRKLNEAKAREAVRENVAKRLGLTDERAASAMVDEIHLACLKFLKDVMSMKHIEARNTALVSFGGGGGLLAGRLAREAGIQRVFVPPFAAVFSAFGSSIMGMAHEYESVASASLRNASGEYSAVFDAVNNTIETLKDRAIHEMALEGFATKDISFKLALELESGSPRFGARVSFPKLRVEGKEDAKHICAELARVSLKEPTGQIRLQRIWLTASCPLAQVDLKASPLEKHPSAAASKGRRKVFWDGDFKDVAIYERSILRPGSVVEGPAIVESEDTNIVVLGGQKFSTNEYLFGLIEER